MTDAAGPDEALAGLVGAIGSPAFPARFLAAMRAIAGVELCSVFLREPGDTVSLVFAEGQAEMPEFPVRASLEYARNYWRSDHQITRLSRSGRKAPVVVRNRAADIADPAWRAACYERAGVRERLSIFWPGPPTLVANGYRTAIREPFSADDIARLERHAALLMAAVERHHSLGAAHVHSEAGVAQSLLALRCGLSAREAEISAAMILGETQEEIAERKRLSHGSVVTYRRRAYGKLGVGNRRDLQRLHRGIIAGVSVDTSGT
jgi:DNA-binding CsgD family transcriptional regulator